MSIANQLGGIYTNLNTAFNDANSALIEKGGDRAINILNIGNKIRGLTASGSDELAMIIDPSNEINLVLPRVNQIRQYAFYGFDNLQSVTIPDSVTSIGREAFRYCVNLNNVSIVGNSLESIKDYAFSECIYLTNFIIPDSVISIGNRVFYACNRLTDIYLCPINPPSFAGDQYSISSSTIIHVPVGSGDAYKSATNWSTFADNIVEDIAVE